MCLPYGKDQFYRRYTAAVIVPAENHEREEDLKGIGSLGATVTMRIDQIKCEVSGPVCDGWFRRRGINHRWRNR